MKRLFFVVPAYRRYELTQLCLLQLARTCDELEAYGLEATAVVIADDENLGSAEEVGFWTIRQENEPLGRKFNDGIELACREEADYVVPFGSDNWVHPSWFTRLPEGDEVVCHRKCGIVRPDGLLLAYITVSYDGGDGIRIFPAELFRRVGMRPAADYRNRGIDTSIVERLRRFGGWTPTWTYHDVHQLEVVGFQSRDVQLNDYEGLVRHFGKPGAVTKNVWGKLADLYPQSSVDLMEEYFATRRAVVR